MPTTATHKKHHEPFELPRRVIDQARPIASRYQLKLWREEGRWYAQGIEEPGAMGDGKTIATAVRNAREALAGVIASHIVDGEPIVTPIVDQERCGRKAS